MIDLEELKQNAHNTSDSPRDYVQQQSFLAIAEQLKRIADALDWWTENWNLRN